MLQFMYFLSVNFSMLELCLFKRFDKYHVSVINWFQQDDRGGVRVSKLTSMQTEYTLSLITIMLVEYAFKSHYLFMHMEYAFKPD